MWSRNHLIWDILALDVDFGFDDRIYVSDWVAGWNMTGKGRIFRLFDPVHVNDPIVKQTKELFAQGFAQRSVTELVGLLRHADQRVRQEAQLALADKGVAGREAFEGVLKSEAPQLARIQAVWGLGILARKTLPAVSSVVPLLQDTDPELRAQAAKILGDAAPPKPLTD